MTDFTRLLSVNELKQWREDTQVESLFRQAFSHLNTTKDCTILSMKTQKSRKSLIDIAPIMAERLKTNLLRHLPFFFIVDHRRRDRSGMFSLRWRDKSSGRTGNSALLHCLHSDEAPLIKLNLIEAERERLLFNFRLSLLQKMEVGLGQLEKQLALLDKIENEIQNDNLK